MPALAPVTMTTLSCRWRSIACSFHMLLKRFFYRVFGIVGDHSKSVLTRKSFSASPLVFFSGCLDGGPADNLQLCAIRDAGKRGWGSAVQRTIKQGYGLEIGAVVL